MKTLLAAVLLLSGCASYRNAQEDQKAQVARPYAIADILRDADENIVKADVAWKETFGRFSGTVADVGTTSVRTRDASGSCVYWPCGLPAKDEKRSYVSMTDPSAKAVFMCIFRDSKYDDASRLSRGRPATVAGHILSVTRADDGAALVTAIRCSLLGGD